MTKEAAARLGNPAASMHRSIRLDPTGVSNCWERVLSLATNEVHRLESDAAITSAAKAASYLPEEVVVAALEYRSRRRPIDVLFLNGFVPPDLNPGPTPTSPLTEIQTPHARAAGLSLLALSLLLGEPFNFATFYGGRLLQHVLPVPGMEDTQTGESSTGMLDWHVEDGFTSHRCHYFALLCLRAHASASTLVSSAANLDLPVNVTETLRAARFALLPDSAHGNIPIPREPIAVLQGPEDAPEIAFDAHYLAPLSSTDKAAYEALNQLRQALDSAARSFTLSAGDLVVIDNRRTVHGRRPFKATNDGADRWLLRAMICSSIPEFQRHRGRIVDLSLEPRAGEFASTSTNYAES